MIVQWSRDFVGPFRSHHASCQKLLLIFFRIVVSIIFGYFTFFLSSSSCDQSKSFNKLANFGVDSRFSISRMAAFNSLATWKKKRTEIQSNAMKFVIDLTMKHYIIKLMINGLLDIFKNMLQAYNHPPGLTTIPV